MNLKRNLASWWIKKSFKSPFSRKKNENFFTQSPLFLLFQREVTAKEAIPVVTFMLTSNHEVTLLEVTEMLLHYLESKVAKDQMFLVLYEAKR